MWDDIHERPRQPLSKRFDLAGYPNIKVFRNGVLVSTYRGRRNTRGFVDGLRAEKAKQVSARCCLLRRSDTHRVRAHLRTNDRGRVSVGQRERRSMVAVGAVGGAVGRRGHLVHGDGTK